MPADRHALLIGVWDYQRLEPLTAPRRDVEVLGNVLEDSTIGDYRVETVANPDHGSAEDALGRFLTGRRPGQTLLVYMSGHGVCDGGGDFYFATVETDGHRPGGTAVPGDFIRHHLEACRASTVVLLVDCCYSGAILPRMKGADVPRRTGRAILTATQAHERASQGWDRRLSVFTEGVVDGLVTGRADVDGAGVITAQSLFDYVDGFVRSKRADQNPDLLNRGTPIIARTARVSVAVPMSVQPPPIARRAETPAAGSVEPDPAALAAAPSASDRATRIHATLSRLDRVLDQSSDSLLLRRQRAWLCSELGEHCDAQEALRWYGEALSDLDACLADRPGDPVSLRLRGNVLRMLGRFDAALADLDAALVERPDDAVAHRLRGDVLRMLGRPDEALAALDACLARRPDDPVALRIRGDVRRALGRYDVALADLDRSLALRPGDELSRRIRDDVRRVVDRAWSMLGRLDRVLELIPGDRVAITMRARAYRTVGDYDRATADIDRLLSEQPDDVAVRRLRGEIHYARARYGLALADFRYVLADRPGDPIVEAYATNARRAGR